MAQSLQPLLHDRVVALRAPAQLWCGPDGSIGGAAIDGLYLGDTRFVRRFRVRIGGSESELIATLTDGPSRVRFVSLHRGLDDAGADPDVRSTLAVEVRGDGVDFTLALESRLEQVLETTVLIDLVTDLTSMDRMKHGLDAEWDVRGAHTEDGALAWGDGDLAARFVADGAGIALDADGQARVELPLTVGAGGKAEARWSIELADGLAVVHPPVGPAPWAPPDLQHADPRLAQWVRRGLADLDALRLVSDRAPEAEFLAAGAPWFFTLFGRDALWTARFLVPLGPLTAELTLRTLAAYRGGEVDAGSAQQPGKILHELRRSAIGVWGEGFHLPPVYYGSIDSTPLWICLLADARDAGLPDQAVRDLLPTLVGALEWMRGYGDSDGDGLLEYVDETGAGLANQGWKDSSDSVQWRDGSLATAPIALCEVQGYAYEAAVRGAALLDSFVGQGEGDRWREWAARLRRRFNESFWIDDPDGGYPAIALDASKRPVDSLTSNIGHLLGTGIIDAAQEALVARRLVSPELDSGYGLRTLSTRDAGYWPLAYHGGSVWAHDTAIAVFGLARAGFAAEARALAEGLLRAAVAFDYRIPELYAGDSATAVPAPVPYPAACRPQAWAAAASVAVLSALPTTS